MIANTSANTLHRAVHGHVEPGSTLHTDEHGGYLGLDGLFYTHESINHGSGEYVRDGVHTNSIESVWAVTYYALPLWGLTPSASASLGITACYFVVSFARSWAIREAFRKWGS